MLQRRLPPLRPSLALRFSSSSPAMPLHSSPQQAEVSGTLSSEAPNGENETGAPRQPRRRGVPDVNCIFKHLRIKRPGAEPDNDRGRALTVTKNTSLCAETIPKPGSSPPKTPTSPPKHPETSPPPLSPRSRGVSVAKQHRRRGSAENYQLSDEFLLDDQCTRMLEEHSLPTSFGKRQPSRPRKPESLLSSSKQQVVFGNRDSKSRSFGVIEPFDICQKEADDVIRHSEYEAYASTRSPRDSKDEVEPVLRVLRPGMVLLKGYIGHSEQVSIVRECRELGLGPGGFYRPGYKDGAKLRLYMMCLGLDWDPQTRKYQKQRQIDSAKPPGIPCEFRRLVYRAMQDSYTLIRGEMGFRTCDVEDILPRIAPDVCIVNFYTEAGRLGLHQDRDESKDSLSKGLPVVSFSVGDSAEFLYGDQRDSNKAEKLVLESGDVLIFGGESRHVFHGIASIFPNSAPGFLLEETGLRPGRLNLTFRQY